MSKGNFYMADLFCGAGGTSAGALEAIRFLGRTPELTAINHWPIAIDTHEVNHPAARSLCTGVDAVDPRVLFDEGQLDMLWASPECTHHSVARGGRPVSDQSRATAWCVVRWAEALRPPVILVENVPEFETWGPIGTNGRPLKSKKGATFQAWCEALRSLGYKVDHRLLCAADYGDPTTRTRLFVQAVRGHRQLVWPEPTHTRKPDLMTGRRWKSARDVIDWDLPSVSIFERKRPLAPNTLARIKAGLAKFGGNCIVAWDHTSGGAKSGISGMDEPLSTVVTKARHGVVEIQPMLLPQQSGGQCRPVDQPVPTVATAGAIGLIEPYLVSFYGNGQPHSIDEPTPTVTCKDRFGLVRPIIERNGDRFQLDIRFRMLQPHELAAAQGFPTDYQFTGTKSEQVKQIGNAVPRRLARALVAAVVSQRSDVSALVDAEEMEGKLLAQAS